MTESDRLSEGFWDAKLLFSNLKFSLLEEHKEGEDLLQCPVLFYGDAAEACKGISKLAETENLREVTSFEKFITFAQSGPLDFGNNVWPLMSHQLDENTLSFKLHDSENLLDQESDSLRRALSFSGNERNVEPLPFFVAQTSRPGWSKYKQRSGWMLGEKSEPVLQLSNPAMNYECDKTLSSISRELALSYWKARTQIQVSEGHFDRLIQATQSLENPLVRCKSKSFLLVDRDTLDRNLLRADHKPMRSVSQQTNQYKILSKVDSKGTKLHGKDTMQSNEDRDTSSQTGQGRDTDRGFLLKFLNFMTAKTHHLLTRFSEKFWGNRREIETDQKVKAGQVEYLKQRCTKHAINSKIEMPKKQTIDKSKVRRLQYCFPTTSTAAQLLGTITVPQYYIQGSPNVEIIGHSGIFGSACTGGSQVSMTFLLFHFNNIDQEGIPTLTTTSQVQVWDSVAGSFGNPKTISPYNTTGSVWTNTANIGVTRFKLKVTEATDRFGATTNAIVNVVQDCPTDMALKQSDINTKIANFQNKTITSQVGDQKKSYVVYYLNYTSYANCTLPITDFKLYDTNGVDITASSTVLTLETNGNVWIDVAAWNKTAVNRIGFLYNGIQHFTNFFRVVVRCPTPSLSTTAIPAQSLAYNSAATNYTVLFRMDTYLLGDQWVRTSCFPIIDVMIADSTGVFTINTDRQWVKVTTATPIQFVMNTYNLNQTINMKFKITAQNEYDENGNSQAVSVLETNAFTVSTFCPTPTITNIANTTFVSVLATTSPTNVTTLKSAYFSTTGTVKCSEYEFQLEVYNNLTTKTWTNYTGTIISLNTAFDISADKGQYLNDYFRVRITQKYTRVDQYTAAFLVNFYCPTMFTGSIAAYNYSPSATDTSDYLFANGSSYSKPESTGAAVNSVCLLTYSLEYATSNTTSPFTYAAYTGTNVTIDSATGDLKVNRLQWTFIQLRIKRVNALGTIDTSITTTVHGTCPSWFTGTLTPLNYQIAATDTSPSLSVVYTGSSYSAPQPSGTAAVSSICAITYALEIATSNTTTPFTYAAYTGTNAAIDQTGAISVNKTQFNFLQIRVKRTNSFGAVDTSVTTTIHTQCPIVTSGTGLLNSYSQDVSTSTTPQDVSATYNVKALQNPTNAYCTITRSVERVTDNTTSTALVWTPVTTTLTGDQCVIFDSNADMTIMVNKHCYEVLRYKYVNGQETRVQTSPVVWQVSCPAVQWFQSTALFCTYWAPNLQNDCGNGCWRDYNCPRDDSRHKECPMKSIKTEVINSTAALWKEYPPYFTSSSNGGYSCYYSACTCSGGAISGQRNGMDAKFASLPTVPYCSLTYELWFWDISDPAQANTNNYTLYTGSAVQLLTYGVLHYKNIEPLYGYFMVKVKQYPTGFVVKQTLTRDEATANNYGYGAWQFDIYCSLASTTSITTNLNPPVVANTTRVVIPVTQIIYSGFPTVPVCLHWNYTLLNSTSIAFINTTQFTIDSVTGTLTYDQNQLLSLSYRIGYNRRNCYNFKNCTESYVVPQVSTISITCPAFQMNNVAAINVATTSAENTGTLVSKYLMAVFTNFLTPYAAACTPTFSLHDYDLNTTYNDGGTWATINSLTGELKLNVDLPKKKNFQVKLSQNTTSGVPNVQTSGLFTVNVYCPTLAFVNSTPMVEATYIIPNTTATSPTIVKNLFEYFTAGSYFNTTACKPTLQLIEVVGGVDQNYTGTWANITNGQLLIDQNLLDKRTFKINITVPVVSTGLIQTIKTNSFIVQTQCPPNVKLTFSNVVRNPASPAVIGKVAQINQTTHYQIMSTSPRCALTYYLEEVLSPGFTTFANYTGTWVEMAANGDVMVDINTLGWKRLVINYVQATNTPPTLLVVKSQQFDVDIGCTSYTMSTINKTTDYVSDSPLTDKKLQISQSSYLNLNSLAPNCIPTFSLEYLSGGSYVSYTGTWAAINSTGSIFVDTNLLGTQMLRVKMVFPTQNSTTFNTSNAFNMTVECPAMTIKTPPSRFNDTPNATVPTTTASSISFNMSDYLVVNSASQECVVSNFQLYQAPGGVISASAYAGSWMLIGTQQEVRYFNFLIGYEQMVIKFQQNNATKQLITYTTPNFTTEIKCPNVTYLNISNVDRLLPEEYQNVTQVLHNGTKFNSDYFSSPTNQTVCNLTYSLYEFNVTTNSSSATPYAGTLAMINSTTGQINYDFNTVDTMNYTIKVQQTNPRSLLAYNEWISKPFQIKLYCPVIQKFEIKDYIEVTPNTTKGNFTLLKLEEHQNFTSNHPSCKMSFSVHKVFNGTTNATAANSPLLWINASTGIISANIDKLANESFVVRYALPTKVVEYSNPFRVHIFCPFAKIANLSEEYVLYLPQKNYEVPQNGTWIIKGSDYVFSNNTSPECVINYTLLYLDPQTQVFVENENSWIWIDKNGNVAVDQTKVNKGNFKIDWKQKQQKNSSSIFTVQVDCPGLTVNLNETFKNELITVKSKVPIVLTAPPFKTTVWEVTEWQSYFKLHDMACPIVSYLPVISGPPDKLMTSEYTSLIKFDQNSFKVTINNNLYKSVILPGFIKTLNSGGVAAYQPITWEIIGDVPYNGPAKYPGLVASLNVTVLEEEVLKNVPQGELVYDSPIPEDPEKDIIEKLSFDGLDKIPCKCVKMKANKDYSFQLSVDKNKITKSDSGTWTIKTILYDIKPIQGQLQLPGMQAIDLVVKFIEIPKNETSSATNDTKSNSTSGNETAVSNETAASEKPLSKEEAKAAAALASSGFEPLPGVGFVFPGIDPEKLDAARAAAAKDKDKKKEEVIPEPELSMGNMDSEGNIKFKFNQEMLFPEVINQNFYKTIFTFSIKSSLDGSTTYGRFVSNKQAEAGEQSQRRLQDEEIVDKNPLDFFLQCTSHDALGIGIKAFFDSPGEVSSGGNFDQMKVEILTLAPFRSAITMKAPVMSKENKALTFDAPKIITNKKQAEALESMTDMAKSVVNMFTTSNGFLGIILGGSMQQLFGMIRAMQMIVITALVKVNLPVHAFLFVIGAMQFAKMDVLDGAGYYSEWFEFHETRAFNQNFSFLGIEDKNFIMNSGSYFILVFFIFAYNFVAFVIQKICKRFARYKIVRLIGMYFYCEDYWKEIKFGFQTLLLESYFDLGLALMLNMIALTMNTDGPFAEFWTNYSDIINSSLTLIYFVMLGVFPVYGFYRIVKHSKEFIDDADLNERYHVYLGESKLEHLNTQLYNMYFLLRRFLTVQTMVMIDIPFFQTSLLMVMSTINFIYMVSAKPLVSKSENKIELFNELCILLCCHLMTTFLNIAMPAEFAGVLGWVFVGVATFNVIFNLSCTIYTTLMEFKEKIQKRRQQNLVAQALGLRKKTRNELVNILGEGQNEGIQAELNFEQAVFLCKVWTPHRKWLKSHDIDFSQFPEEREYQLLVENFQMLQKAKLGQIANAIKYIAVQQTHEEIEKQKLAKKCEEKKENEENAKRKYLGLPLKMPKAKLKLSIIEEENESEDSNDSEDEHAPKNIYRRNLEMVKKEHIFARYEESKELTAGQEIDRQIEVIKLYDGALQSEDTDFIKYAEKAFNFEFNGYFSNSKNKVKSEDELLKKRIEHNKLMQQADSLQFLINDELDNEEEQLEEYGKAMMEYLRCYGPKMIEMYERNEGIRLYRSIGRNQYLLIVNVFFEIEFLARFMLNHEGFDSDTQPFCYAIKKLLTINFQDPLDFLLEKKKIDLVFLNNILEDTFNVRRGQDMKEVYVHIMKKLGDEIIANPSIKCASVIKKKLRCPNKHAVDETDKYYVLDLPHTPYNDLLFSLREYFKQKEQPMVCKTCKSKTKRNCIGQLSLRVNLEPEILALGLPSFEINKENRGASKNLGRVVDIPLNVLYPPSGNSKIYEIMALVYCDGVDLFNSKYVFVIKRKVKGDHPKPYKWLEYWKDEDDETLHFEEIEIEHRLNCVPVHMVFYKKTN